MTSEEKKHAFTIIVNNQEYSTTDHELTGAQIKALAKIPADYGLFEVKGNNTVPVANDQEVHIHEKAEFRAIPAGTFGGHEDASASS